MTTKKGKDSKKLTSQRTSPLIIPPSYNFLDLSAYCLRKPTGLLTACPTLAIALIGVETKFAILSILRRVGLDFCAFKYTKARHVNFINIFLTCLSHKILDMARYGAQNGKMCFLCFMYFMCFFAAKPKKIWAGFDGFFLKMLQCCSFH